MATAAKAPKKRAARKPRAPAPAVQAPPPPEPVMPEDKRRAATRLTAGALRAGLKDVLGAIAREGTIPILQNVLLRASERSIELSGTDLDLWVSRTLPADPEADWRGFATTVPAKALDKLLAELPADALVTIDAPGEPSGSGAVGQTASTHPSRASISAGRARFWLPTLPADDLPEPAPFTGAHGFEMPCGALGDALAAVSHAISTEETRYYLNGVFVHPIEREPGDQLRLAATDGHRLSRIALPCPEGAGTFPAAIWPRRLVALLGQLLGAAAKTGSAEDPAQVLVESNAGASVLRFMLPASDGGEAIVTAKAIDGTFPDYTRVIPSGPKHSVIVGRELLATAVRRAAALQTERTRAVRLTFGGGKVAASSNSPDHGEARDEEPCLFEGEDISLGVNAAYLLTCLAAFATDEISIAFDDAGSPLLLRALGSERDGENDRDRLVQVLMPMRV